MARITPDQREESRRRFLRAGDLLEQMNKGAPLPDTPPLGAYAEAFPELMEDPEFDGFDDWRPEE